MKIIKNAGIDSVAGRLTITKINKEFYAPGKQKIVAICKCECGNIISVNLSQFGNKRSCGCINNERVHRKSKTKLYGVWNTIKTRCYTKSSRQYGDYGGRGILMCKGFMGFLYFETFMGEKPTDKHSIERIDNDGWYCCGECDDCIANKRKTNVRWATPSEQAINKRTNFYIEYNGDRLCLTEVSRRCGIPQATLQQRISKLGWSIAEATSTPIKRQNRFIHKGNIGRNQYSNNLTL
jgi:hypothetical protein